MDKQVLLAKGVRRKKGRAASGSYEQSRRDARDATGGNDKDSKTSGRVAVAHEIASSRRELQSVRRGGGSPISTEQEEKKRTTGRKRLFKAG